MDELEIAGKRYISARRAAKEHRYHSDYIGQLIRGKKVVGQKVGRSWYVEEGSLLAYLGKEPSPRPHGVVAAPVVVAEPSLAVVQKKEEIEKKHVVKEVTTITEDAADTSLQPEVSTATTPTPTPTASVEKVFIEEEKIPLRIQTEESEVQTTPSLVYIADDSAMLPPIERSSLEFYRMPSTQESMLEFSASTPTSEKVGLRAAALVAVLGLVVLCTSAVVSSKVASTIGVGEGGAASSGYSIEW